MALYNFHRVLIAATILFFFGFALWSYRQYGVAEQDAANMLALALGSGAISFGLVGYLIYFNYKTRILQSGPRGA